jgi:hypothetical protein
MPGPETKNPKSTEVTPVLPIDNASKLGALGNANSQLDNHIKNIHRAVDAQRQRVESGLPGPLQKSAQEGVDVGTALAKKLEEVKPSINAAAAGLDSKNAAAPVRPAEPAADKASTPIPRPK